MEEDVTQEQLDRKEKKTVTFNLEPEFQSTVTEQEEVTQTTGRGGSTVRRTVTRTVTKVKQGTGSSSVRQSPLVPADFN